MCHALIIEDDWFTADYISQLCQEGGAVSVQMAATEPDAIMAARTVRPDIIISDVRLLEGNGPSAVSQIHCEAGAIPVVYVTAAPFECEYCPAPSAVLLKPIDSVIFLRTFRRFASETGTICHETLSTDRRTNFVDQVASCPSSCTDASSDYGE